VKFRLKDLGLDADLCVWYTIRTEEADVNDEPGRRRRDLRRALERYVQAAEPLFERGQVLRGTIYDTARRCGKEGCRCAAGELHPQAVLKLREERSNRGLKAAARERLEPLVLRYKRFRAARAALQAAHRDIMAQVDELERVLAVDPPSALVEP
jgi:hypothetical protein